MHLDGSAATVPALRRAVVDDAEACAAIYAPYVEETPISFESDAPGAREMARRIEVALASHDWLVLDEPGTGVVGYAYAGPYKERAAYRWSCEVSVYVARDRHRAGLGRTLYLALFDRLAARGFQIVVAGMTLPNPASEALHRALGFEDVGTWRSIGHKQGRWRDVRWMQKQIGDLPDTPSEPTPDLSHI